MIASALVASLAAERAGRLAEASALLAGDGAVLASVRARLALALRGAAAALDEVASAGAVPEAAWSARAALAIAEAAAHLRVHTGPALEPARAAIARAQAALSGAPDDPAAIDDATAAAVRGAGDAARFLCHGSLRSAALELDALASARAGEIRAALAGFDAAYRAGEGDPDRRARVLLAWGVQLRNWGLLDEALRRVERSLELRLELGDLHGAAICHGVIAFVHQRRGDHRAERDALAADLRLCERLGAHADVPGLRARLAGALVGLGKYATAFAEAEAALGSNDARVTGFALREQARVRGAEGRHDDATALATRAHDAFVAVGDAYAAALCELTRAEIELARGDATAARAATARAAPVFARLGALPEAATCALLAAEADGDAAAAARILDRIVPALEQAGFGATPLATRARELAARLSPDAVRDDLVARAARLPGLAARALGRGPGLGEGDS